MEPGPSGEYYGRFAPVASGPIRPPQPMSPLLTAADDPQEFVDTHDTDSLYSILNVERDASEQELKDQYRLLATTYHPDKQGSDAERRAAHRRFTAIQHAYEVLTDDTKRTIYDLYGEEGLRTKWELGPKNLSKKALRARLVKQNEALRRLEVQSLVESKGDLSVMLDARAVFAPRDSWEDPDAVSHTPLARIQRLQTGRLTLKHSYETSIADKTQFAVEGTATCHNRSGAANVSGTIKHQFSPRCWAMFTQTALQPYISTVKGTYVMNNTFINCTAIAQTFLLPYVPPRMTVSVGQKLYRETTGFINFKTGFFKLGPWGSRAPAQLFDAEPSSLSIGLTTARQDGSGWTTELQTGRRDIGITSDWSTMLAGLRLKVGMSLSIHGTSLFAMATAKITSFTTAGTELGLDLGGNVVMKLFVNHLGQQITLPILLSHNNNPYVIFCSSVLPAAGYAAAYRYWILPNKHKRINSRIHELQRQHADWVAQKREEQQEAVLSMQRPVEDKIVMERRRNGLIILDAKYGRADAFTATSVQEVVAWDGAPAIIDVTVPLQMLVQDSRLYIPGGRAKHGLNGFYDPCIGENKKLRVRYEFRGKIHEVTVDDISSLRAPVKGHAVDE